MILYINKLDFLKSAPICWLFDLLAVFILFISMSPSFQLVRYSISQKVHLYSPISPCLVTVTSDVCLCVLQLFFYYIFASTSSGLGNRVSSYREISALHNLNLLLLTVSFYLFTNSYIYLEKERIIRDKTD